jgi:hypothetical protein
MLPMMKARTQKSEGARSLMLEIPNWMLQAFLHLGEERPH